MTSSSPTVSRIVCRTVAVLACASFVQADVRGGPNESETLFKIFQEQYRTMFSLWYLAEWLGASVEATGEGGETRVQLEGRTLSLKPGRDWAQLGGTRVQLGVAPRLEEGVVYVPLRPVVEALAGRADWDSRTGEVRVAHPLRPEALLVPPSSVSAHDPMRVTPMHIEAYSGLWDRLRARLAAGADPDVGAADARTPLHYAAIRNHPYIVRLLLEHGADVHAWDDASARTPLHDAAYWGAGEAAEVLLEHGADADAPAASGRHPLHLAAYRGHTAVAAALMDHGADVNARWEEHASASMTIGARSLHCAADHPHMEMMRLLLRRGADVKARTDEGKTPLHWLSLKRHLEAAQLLIDSGADVNARDEKGRTPLFSVRSAELLQLLVRKGADASVTDDEGRTALHAAARNRAPEVARVLVAAGADVDARDNKGKTPLFEARGLDIAQALLDSGAALDSVDHEGKTPLHGLAAYGSVEALKLLMQQGADVNVRDNSDWTPLHEAAAAGWSAATVVALLEHGADPDARSKDGRRPLDVIPKIGHSPEVMEILTLHTAPD